MFFQSIGEIVALFVKTLRSLPQIWRHRQKLYEQLHEIGNASLWMACLLSLFIGGVIALQTGPVMVSRGLGNYIGGMVGYSVCRELAPVMMAMLMAGRIGSAMAAEIGSMRVYQEIDALETMNINPIHYLVLPRLVGIAIALPILVLFAVIVAWLGGAIVAMYSPDIHISFANFSNNLKEIVDMEDVLDGLFKSFVFALVIGTICCHQGLATIGGPRGIGRSVTKAVVNSLVLILILDYFLTRFLLYFEDSKLFQYLKH